MYGLADAAHPPRAEASSTTAAAAAADLQHHSVTDAAKLLLGNLWRADDVYFEAVKADDGRYNVSFVSPAVERLLGVPPEAALAAWRGCADALSGGVHSQARGHLLLLAGAALDQTTCCRTRRTCRLSHARLTPKPQDASRVDGHARSGLHGAGRLESGPRHLTRHRVPYCILPPAS